MSRRRIELIGGVLAGVVGIAGLAAALFWETNFGGPFTKVIPSWWDRTVWFGHGIDLQLALFGAAMVVALAAVAFGAYLYAARDTMAGLAIEWIGALALVAGAVLDLPAWAQVGVNLSGVTTWNAIGIGIFLVPAAAIALVVAVADTVERPAAGRPMAASPM